MSGSRTALTVSGLTVARRTSPPDAAPVLDGLSFSLAPGECLAVVGESGAGKSVLARTLLGLPQGEPGWRVRAAEFEVAGTDARALSQRGWRALRGSGIGLVLQDALQSLDPLRTIEAEVGEVLAIRGRRRAGRRRAALEALSAAGLPGGRDRLSQRSGELSGGMRQRALIAAALAGEPAILVADEPTTALDPTTAERILAQFREIAARGTAVLFISHDLGAVARVADRVAVLDRGRFVEEGPVEEIMRRPRAEATRTLVSAIPSGAKPSPAPAPGPSIMRLTSATRRFRTPGGSETGLLGVDLELRRGEALGIVGESGAGKSTLARILVGADAPDEPGSRVTDPGLRIRLIPQDPVATFDPRWRVERIISASIRRPRSGPALSPVELLERVGLGPELLRRRPATLSGGQRQRVAIARALAADPDVLVCDEPVSALDMSTQAGILDLLRGLQARGVTIVFVSHDLAAVRAVCDRVVEMAAGRITAEGSAEDLLAPRG